MWIETATIFGVGVFFVWGVISLWLLYQNKRHLKKYNPKDDPGKKPIPAAPKKADDDLFKKPKELPTFPSIDIEQLKAEILKE